MKRLGQVCREPDIREYPFPGSPMVGRHFLKHFVGHAHNRALIAGVWGIALTLDRYDYLHWVEQFNAEQGDQYSQKEQKSGSQQFVALLQQAGLSGWRLRWLPFLS